MQETQVPSLDWEDSLEDKMATYSSILAWKSYGQRSLEGYSPWDCSVDIDASPLLHRRKDFVTNVASKTPDEVADFILAWSERPEL